ncbi:MAG: dienelactone hydrolase family protein [Anaerolineales bacterium]|nr:dienelactone hydrolase family protein [Anaerolineales bacterium]
MTANIHQRQPVINFGDELEDAELVVILLHGRGATAESMLPIAETLQMEGLSFLIPQAALNRWYPNTAFGPLEANEPDLSSALETVDSLVEAAREKGFSDQQIVFGGFSQGACLAAEYVARNARKYAGLFVFSGALIGPRGMPRNYPGSFDGMPVFIGGSDIDPWVAHDFISATANVFEKMGASVDFRTYPGMGHTVNQDEIDSVRKMFEKIKQASVVLR